ncbi:phosphotransferase family protein [Nocardia aobensis]|uniref:Phosphotransferase family protein n=1 Tax=Nocardia aobensis TaxID=257277 RepID=A0ABW6PF57_9NOCA
MIGDHLARRGIASAASDLEVRPLTGGVSNDVFAVTGPGLNVVVKRALGQLRVAETWLADPARIDTEGRALRLADRITPGSVPRVIDFADGYLVIERAPETWHTWKDELLAGTVRLSVARALGHALRRWQLAGAAAAQDFADRTAFTQLRVDPFHRVIRERHPDLAAPVDETLSIMADSSACLVHGDYTPKNVMVDPAGDGMWVIDWEVAHLGDPTFDPAWTIGHLLLKSLHRPATAQQYAAAALAFLDALAMPLDEAQLVRQTGCLVLARVDGKSPADYLDDYAADRARELGRRLLLDPPAVVTDAWKDLS